MGTNWDAPQRRPSIWMARTSFSMTAKSVVSSHGLTSIRTDDFRNRTRTLCSLLGLVLGKTLRLLSFKLSILLRIRAKQVDIILVVLGMPRVG